MSLRKHGFTFSVAVGAHFIPVCFGRSSHSLSSTLMGIMKSIVLSHNVFSKDYAIPIDTSGSVSAPGRCFVDRSMYWTSEKLINQMIL